jgi:hypothetical protein
MYVLFKPQNPFSLLTAYNLLLCEIGYHQCVPSTTLTGAPTTTTRAPNCPTFSCNAPCATGWYQVTTLPGASCPSCLCLPVTCTSLPTKVYIKMRMITKTLILPNSDVHDRAYHRRGSYRRLELPNFQLQRTLRHWMVPGYHSPWR